MLKLRDLTMRRAIDSGLAEQQQDVLANGRPRWSSTFCLAYTVQANIEARLTPEARKRYHAGAFTSISYDVPTVDDLRQAQALADQQYIDQSPGFEATGRTLADG